MSQLFLILAALNFLALLAAFVIGAISAFGGQSMGPYYIWHFTFGLFSAVGTLLVHCIIFTYFLGTGRWVKEVAQAYDLPDEPLPKKTRELKRVSFPPALFAMLIVIAASAAGAGVQLQAWPWYVHGTLAVLTLVINLWAYWVEFRCLSENSEVLAKVLTEVDRIRAASGLPSNEEALLQEQQTRVES
ncbi:MAG: hypothetical protein ACFCD0_27425 [Gemmataceae bacterium]